MPCHTPTTEEILKSESNALKDEVNRLEAIICAMLTELPSFNINVEQFIGQAEAFGKVKIKDLWLKHQIKDEKRLLNELNKFSRHEISLLKEILKNPNLIK